MASKKSGNTPKVNAVKKTSEDEKKDVKDVKASVYIEYGNGQIYVKNILEDVKAAYAAENKDEPAETIEIYIKPEDNAAYYVVNGKSEGKKIDLHFYSET